MYHFSLRDITREQIANILPVPAPSIFMIACRSLRWTGVYNTLESNLHRPLSRMMGTTTNGDLNNATAARVLAEITTDPIYRDVSFAIPASEDDALVRQTYRPFLLDNAHSELDWIARLELSTALKMVDSQILKSGGERLKVLVLHGSMRKR